MQTVDKFLQLFNEKSAHTVNMIRQREKKMRKQRAPPGGEVESMEVPEELKRFNSMTDKEQQEHAEEIAETIEKLMREGKLPYYGKRK